MQLLQMLFSRMNLALFRLIIYAADRYESVHAARGVGSLVLASVSMLYVPRPVNPNCTDQFAATVKTGITAIVGILEGIGIAAAVIGIIVGGLMRVTAFGNERRIAASNAAITGAVVGLVIVLVSVALGDSIPTWFQLNANGCGL